MTILLTYLTTTIDLHPDLLWEDEHSWHPVEQTIQRTVTGAMIVSSAARIGGRPITLRPDGDDSAWMAQSTVDAIRNLAVIPGAVMQLTVRGVSRDVAFRHHDTPAVEAVPVVHYADSAGGDWFRLTLKFLEL